MTVNITIESKVEESDIIVDKLFTENPSLNKKFDDFIENSDWFYENKEGLRKEYGDNHIAVYEKKICLADKDPIKLIKSVKTKYGDDPSVMVTFIGKEKVNFLL